MLCALERSFLSLSLGFPPNGLRGCQGLNDLRGHNYYYSEVGWGWTREKFPEEGKFELVPREVAGFG